MQREFVCAAALGAFLGSPAWGQDSKDPEIESLRQEVAELKESVAALKAGQEDPNHLSRQRAAQIRAMVLDVLADADARNSLQGSGATAGWDKGFFLSSADGNWLVKIGGELQIRYVFNQQENSPTDDNRSGFEIRRAKINFQGHIIDPTWKYRMLIGIDRATGTFQTEDHTYIEKDLGGGWLVRVGQTKAPFLREEVLSSTKLMAVERSLVNSTFTAGTVQGVMVGWEGDSVHA